MDMYGKSNAVMEANSLHGQIGLEASLAQDKYHAALDKFNLAIKNQKANDSQANNVSDAEDLTSLQSIYTTGRGIYGGIRGGMTGASEAYTSARTGISAATSLVGSAATDAATGGLSDAAQAAFLAQSSSVSRGLGTAAAAVSEAGEGAGVIRSALSGVGGAVRGAAQGLGEVGGDATKFGSKLSGVEGIAQKVVSTIGAGDDLGFIAGKAVGALGGIIAGGEQINSLIESGGKSAFTRVNEQGQRVAMSGLDKASEFLSEASSVADVAAAATGGMAVPIAAALGLAGAITGALGAYKDEKTDDAQIGLKPDGTTDASKAPKLADTVSHVEAFTGLGFVGSATHNPLAHIA